MYIHIYQSGLYKHIYIILKDNQTQIRKAFYFSEH